MHVGLFCLQKVGGAADEHQLGLHKLLDDSQFDMIKGYIYDGDGGGCGGALQCLSLPDEQATMKTCDFAEGPFRQWELSLSLSLSPPSHSTQLSQWGRRNRSVLKLYAKCKPTLKASYTTQDSNF